MVDDVADWDYGAAVGAGLRVGGRRSLGGHSAYRNCRRGVGESARLQRELRVSQRIGDQKRMQKETLFAWLEGLVIYLVTHAIAFFVGCVVGYLLCGK